MPAHSSRLPAPMLRRANRALILALVLPLAACAAGSNTMRLYPLEGEIAQSDPTKVITAQATNTVGTSGTLTFRLPKRGRCEGTWTSLTPRTVSNKNGMSLTLKKTGGEVGRETKTVAGVNNGEIYAVCADGTRVQGTFVVGSGTSSGTGTASDTAGNVYKLLF